PFIAREWRMASSEWNSLYWLLAIRHSPLTSRLRHLIRRHQRGGIAKGIADVVGDIRDLLVRQLLRIGRHRSRIGRAGRRHGLCAVEDDAQRGGGVGGLQQR